MFESSRREVEAVDPRTGMIRRLHLTFDGVLALLQPLLYTPDSSSLLLMWTAVSSWWSSSRSPKSSEAPPDT